jgi:hypothetical protein
MDSLDTSIEIDGLARHFLVTQIAKLVSECPRAADVGRSILASCSV